MPSRLISLLFTPYNFVLGITYFSSHGLKFSHLAYHTESASSGKIYIKLKTFPCEDSTTTMARTFYQNGHPHQSCSVCEEPLYLKMIQMME